MSDAPEMSEEEFDVLEELYFTLSFQELTEATNLEPGRLLEVVKGLHQKGWLKLLHNESEAEEKAPDWQSPQTYKYLASKQGLLAHNGMQ